MLKSIARPVLHISAPAQSCVASKCQISQGRSHQRFADFLGRSSKYRFLKYFRRTDDPLPEQRPPLADSPTNLRLAHRSMSPRVYSEASASWRELSSIPFAQDGNRSLERGSLLKIVSWNIDFTGPEPAARIAAGIEYLRTTFSENPGQLVIMLQEVCQESAQQILQTRWIQQNFSISGHEAPRTFRAGIPSPAPYFTMMMTPKHLQIESAFRMPLPSDMGRDALFVDIPLASSNRTDSTSKDTLRLCTTHLESLEGGHSLRTRQLGLISQKLKNDGKTVGLVGGDMNAIYDSEHTLPHQFGLRDAWEGVSQPSSLNEDEVDTFGQASGHTWGYQSIGTKWAPQRLDKFLYTQGVHTVPIDGSQRIGMKVERLAIGLTIDVSMKEGSLANDRRKKVWLSNHFAIAIGIKVT